MSEVSRLLREIDAFDRPGTAEFLACEAADLLDECERVLQLCLNENYSNERDDQVNAVLAKLRGAQ